MGTHIPVGGGLHRAGLAHARAAGAAAVQVFVGNPRGWARTAGDAEQDARFRDECRAARIPVFVHAPYLVNLGSPSAVTGARSVEALRHALARGAALGAAGVVVHAGSSVDSASRDEALRRTREGLLPLLDEVPDGGPRVLVEPTAGGGQALAARVDDLAPYLAALDDDPRVGLCLDTCHLHAAGHDLAAPGGMRGVLGAVVKAVGRGRIGLVHANDSRDAVGSTRDRHAPLGEGTIGIEPFAELFRHAATRGVPVVLETPGDAARHARDIATLVALRDRA